MPSMKNLSAVVGQKSSRDSYDNEAVAAALVTSQNLKARP